MGMWDDKCPECGKINRSTAFCKCLLDSTKPTLECPDCDGSGLHNHGTVECLDCGTVYKSKKSVINLVDGRATYCSTITDHGNGGVTHVCKKCHEFFTPVGEEWICEKCAPIEECMQCNTPFAPSEEGQCICGDCLDWQNEAEADHRSEMGQRRLPL